MSVSCLLYAYAHSHIVSSSSQLSQQLEWSRKLLLSVFSCTRIIPVGPHPAIEALFETKNNGEADNEEGETPTNGPEVALRLIRVGDPLKIHSEIRLQVLSVSMVLSRWIWITSYVRRTH